MSTLIYRYGMYIVILAQFLALFFLAYELPVVYWVAYKDTASIWYYYFISYISNGYFILALILWIPYFMELSLKEFYTKLRGNIHMLFKR